MENLTIARPADPKAPWGSRQLEWMQKVVPLTPMKKPALVETQFFTFAKAPEDAFRLENGASFGPITLAYETYGQLSAARDNAILVFHALSGSQHAAGYNPRRPAAGHSCGAGNLWTDECHTGWWDSLVGPGKALDTRQYFIICANYFGGCYGSTGPGSIDPRSGKPYGSRFPDPTLADVVNTQTHLLDHLGIRTLLAVAGGSLGGVMAVDFAMRYPERTHALLAIGIGPRATTLHKLSNFEQICSIEWDPHFSGGDYYDAVPPTRGLMLARMISHKTFLHLHLMEERARSEIAQEDDDLNGYRLQHQIESYMLHAVKKFVTRFDANTYLRIIKIWQQFDLSARAGGNLAEALRPCRNHRILIFSIDSDVCFWPEEQAEICEALKEIDARYLHITVHSEKGHDSFLLEPELYTPNIQFLLRETHKEEKVKNAPDSDITEPATQITTPTVLEIPSRHEARAEFLKLTQLYYQREARDKTLKVPSSESRELLRWFDSNLAQRDMADIQSFLNMFQADIKEEYDDLPEAIFNRPRIPDEAKGSLHERPLRNELEKIILRHLNSLRDLQRRPGRR